MPFIEACLYCVVKYSQFELFSLTLFTETDINIDSISFRYRESFTIKVPHDRCFMTL